jgi:DHA3 family macrolide efflux protein-like MFS transporter
VLGLVKSALAAGAIAGGLLVIAWGGPKKKVRGVLLGWLLGGLFGVALFGVNGGEGIWLAAGFCGGFLPQIIDSANQSIWQAKVPPGMQGRVFSASSVIAQITSPLAVLLIGPLADQVFEPAMQSQVGPLPFLFSWLTGLESGSGMMVFFLIAGLGIGAVSLVAFANSAVRNIETLIPDHDEIGVNFVP